MTFIHASRLTARTPDGRTLFHEIQLSIGTGKTALVGANGSGKTTLLHILAGLNKPDSGELIRHGRLGLMPQESSPTRADGKQSRVVDVLGVGEAYDAMVRIFKGTAALHDFDLMAERWDLEHLIATVLARVNLSHKASHSFTNTLSGGEATRLRLAAALIHNPDLLLLDEPTNHLDSRQRAEFLRLIDQLNLPLIMVSHDRDVLRWVDQIIELREGRVSVYGGNWEFFEAAKQREIENAQQALTDAQKKLLARERQAELSLQRQYRRTKEAERNSNGSMPKILRNALRNAGERSTASLAELHDQRVAQARLCFETAKKAARKSPIIRVDTTESTVKHKCLIELQDVLPQPISPTIWKKPIDLELYTGDRLRIDGPNGSGKTHLIQILLGQTKPLYGEVHLHTTSVALLEQLGRRPMETDSSDSQETVWSLLRRESSVRYDDTLLRTRLARFLFVGDDIYKPVSVLSGGEWMRLRLAQALATDPPDILILDEPTNHLDLDARIALVEALKEYRGTLIFVSHDQNFVDSVGINFTLELR